MRAVINCDVLHQYHHLFRKSRLINGYVDRAVFLEINNFYLCISISENSTGGHTLSHNSVFGPTFDL